MIRITLSEICIIVQTLEKMKKTGVSKNEVWKFVLYNIDQLDDEYMNRDGKKLIRWFEKAIDLVYSNN